MRQVTTIFSKNGLYGSVSLSEYKGLYLIGTWDSRSVDPVYKTFEKESDARNALADIVDYCIDNGWGLKWQGNVAGEN